MPLHTVFCSHLKGTPRMTVTLRRITPEETRPLRQQLLRQGVPLDRLVYPGDMEPDSFHVGAFNGDEQVGIATVMCQPPNLSRGVPPIHMEPDHPRGWRLRGMATTDDMRGQGIGSKMLAACIGHVAVQGGAFLWCEARIAAREFYLRNKFRVIGDAYHVPDVGPHFFMQREIVPSDVDLALEE
jgi:GNAT superfamily N-acetyltransferase